MEVKNTHKSHNLYLNEENVKEVQKIQNIIMGGSNLSGLVDKLLYNWILENKKFIYEEEIKIETIEEFKQKALNKLRTLSEKEKDDILQNPYSNMIEREIKKIIMIEKRFGIDEYIKQEKRFNINLKLNDRAMSKE